MVEPTALPEIVEETDRETYSTNGPGGDIVIGNLDSEDTGTEV